MPVAPAPATCLNLYSPSYREGLRLSKNPARKTRPSPWQRTDEHMECMQLGEHDTGKMGRMIGRPLRGEDQEEL